MKKSMLAIGFLGVLIGLVLGPAFFHQGGVGKKETDQGGRKILYYVDPMNPAHTSDRPGLAPCGMPMEPVYADNQTPGSEMLSRYIPPGTVKITPEKQQTIGVRVEKVEMTSEGHAVRTLGRVAADENLTYQMVATIEGWLQDVRGCTTGSLVQKDQVMALINSYSVDFYNWQWQYITYTAYQRPPGTQVPKTRLPMVQPPEALQNAAPQAEPQQFEPDPQGSQPAEVGQPETPHHGLTQPQGMRPAARFPIARSPGAQHPAAAASEARHDLEPQAEAQESPPKRSSSKQYSSIFSLVDSTTYKAKLELMNVGLREEQLDEIARTGQYQTQVEIRSPVTGFVLTRTVSPWQKIEKGAELYRVADLSRVWILADVFEREAPFVRPGTAARVTIPHQRKSLEAEVTDVLPRFDTETRTLKVRIELDNPDFALVPDMFVDVELLISRPPAITVPVDAVLDSGLRKTAFVDVGNGFFEPRSVNTGWRHGGRLEIVQGLMPGESIVVSGNFLVDSESRMKLAAAGLHGTLSKDPVCDMEVYADKARNEGLISDIDGKMYYFCSTECKTLFDERHGKETGNPAGGTQTDKPTIPDEQSMKGFWKDPVCGMLLSASKAKALVFRSEYHGKTYYFCSAECKKLFDGSQNHYLEKAMAGKGPDRVAGHGGREHD